MRKKILGFTLVELIVVMTILAILSTIAFVAYNGYSSSARDGNRVAEITNITKGLELYKINTGNYPYPTDGEMVTYSGSEVWTQGSFGTNIVDKMISMRKAPLDPLTNNLFTYSLLNTKDEYEIGTILETDDLAFGTINSAYAGNKIVKSYVIGDYNGSIAQVKKSTRLYLLAVPTIINSHIGEVTIQDIINDQGFAYNGSSRIGGSYNYTGIDINGDNTDILVNSGSYVLYDGTVNNLVNNLTAQVQVLENLQSAYDGTFTVSSNSVLSSIIAENINVSEPSESTQFLATNTLNKYAGFKGIDIIGDETQVTSGVGGGGSGGSGEPWYTSFSGAIMSMGEMGGELYILAREVDDGGFDLMPTTGVKLWKTQGTTDTTQLVKEITNNTDLTSVDGFIESDGKMYFTAEDSTYGSELWVTDGTSGGTFMVKDICSGTSGSWPEYLTEFSGKLYFTADDCGSTGEELRVSDGTTGGTQLVKDIRSGSIDSYISFLTVSNDKLYFKANDGSKGYELWVSDGTAVGTVITKDIRLGGSSQPSDFFSYNNILYFRATDGSNGYELWRSDGTEIGTYLLKDISAGSASTTLANWVIYNGLLYFIADGSTYGGELWKTDGTTLGTGLVQDIKSGSGDGLVSNFHIVNYNSKLYFPAMFFSIRVDLWESQGTSVSTNSVTEGINSSGYGFNYPLLTTFNNLLYFVGDNANSGKSVWSSDGTPSGINEVYDAVGTGEIYKTKPFIFKDGIYYRMQTTGFEGYHVIDDENPNGVNTGIYVMSTF